MLASGNMYHELRCRDTSVYGLSFEPRALKRSWGHTGHENKVDEVSRAQPNYLQGD